MKRFGIIFASVIGLGLVAVILFIATFDANRYRPLLVSELQKVLGKPVHIDRVSLGLERDGQGPLAIAVALRLQKVAIAQRPATQAQASLEIDSISVILRLLPLLKKQFVIPAVVLNGPRVHLKRDATGTLGLEGLGVLALPAASTGSLDTSSSLPIALSITSGQVHNGKVQWTDETTQPPSTFQADHLELEFQRRLPASAMSVNLHSDVRGELPTLLFDGKLSLDAQGEWNPSSSASEPFGLHARVASRSLQFNIRSFHFHEGKLQWAKQRPSSQPAGNFVIEALDIQGRYMASGSFGELEASGAWMDPIPNVKFQSRFRLPDASGPVSIESFALTLDGIRLERLFLSRQPSDPQLRGRLHGHIEGSLPRWDPARLSQLLTAHGSLKCEEPVIANLNILRAVFEQLSLIPGLMERLLGSLPPEALAQFERPDTPLEPVDISMTLKDGSVWLETFELTSDALSLTGEGRVGLDGSLHLTATLRIDSVFSQTLTRSVGELRYLSDSQGRIEIPLIIYRQGGRIGFLPQLDAIGRKLLVPLTQDLIGNLLH